MTTFLLAVFVFYTLISVGFVIGYLTDTDDEILIVEKILMVLFAPIFAPIIWELV